MLRADRSSAIALAIAFFCLVWIIDPAYVGMLGREGLFRWGGLCLIALLALGSPVTYAFFATRTFAFQGLFVAVMLVSTMTSGTTAGYVEALRLAPICLAAPLVVACGRAGGRERLRSMLIVLLAGVAVASVASGYLDGRFYRGRLFGVSWHPNALTLVAATLCAVMLFAPLRSRFWSGAGFIAGAWAVVLSDSLLGIVTVLTAVAGKLIQKWLGGRAAIVFLVGSTIFWVFAPLAIALLMQDYRSWFGLVDRSTFQRLVIWHDALRTFLAHPLLGIGFAYEQSFYDLISVVTFYYSHSVTLTYLRTTGVAGLLAIGLLIVHVTGISGRNAGRGDWFSFSLLFPVLMMSSVEAGLQQMPISWILFWLAVGLAMSEAEQEAEMPATAAAPLAVPR